MRVIHSYRKKQIQKNVDDASLILTNKNGSYAHFATTPSSRYQGFFFFHENKMFKIVEDIKVSKDKVTEIKNDYYKATRKRKTVQESFFVPNFRNSLIYELNKKLKIKVSLDVKESYDSRVWGREYDFEEVDDCGLITFTKKTDEREDSTGDELEYTLYIAIKSDGKIKVKNKWIERKYAVDRERNSKPDTRFILEGIETTGKKVVITASYGKKEALAECELVYKNAELLEEKQKTYSERLVDKNTLERIKPEDEKFAYISAVHSLNSLTVQTDHGQAILAGLPWFYQVWARDELISLKAFMLTKEYDVVLDSLKKHFTKLEDGNLPNNESGTLNAVDAVGWYFVRLADLDKKSNIHNSILLNKLTQTVDALATKQTENNFAMSKEKETWMDSIGREGARIEIQALRLAMYNLLYRRTDKPWYKFMEDTLKKSVRKELWNSYFLFDGLSDMTIRPNVFLAFYAYQPLLTKDDWKKCFEKTLEHLWLDFGGVSTVDKTNPMFHKIHTGEDSSSYHNGDSWFWINNLAAICMARLDKKGFAKEIEQIKKASTDEILWSGAISHAAEVTSASALKSQGCLMQAWSAALYVELMHELF